MTDFNVMSVIPVVFLFEGVNSSWLMVHSMIRYREYGFMKWLVSYIDDGFGDVNNRDFLINGY